MQNLAKILSLGWVGQGDFGDEVMAYLLRRLLKQNGINEITYYMLGKYPIYKGRNDINIKSLYTFKTPGIVKRFFDLINLKKFNAVITGGGSILHSVNSIEWKMDVVSRMRKLTKENFKFAASVGVSLGQFNNNLEKKLCGKFIDNNDLVIVRDNFSAQAAQNIKRDKVISSLDISLLLPEICKDEFEKIKNLESQTGRIGVMFVRNNRKITWFDENRMFDKYLQVINNLTKQGKQVFLIALYTGDAYSDVQLNEELLKRAQNPEKIEIYKFDGDIFEMMHQIKTCESIISMRLHGIIFSFMLGIPFVSVEYDKKNSHFCESVNYPKSLCLTSNASSEEIIATYSGLTGLEPLRQALSQEQATLKVSTDFKKLSELLQL